jgi:hypothetical protein
MAVVRWCPRVFAECVLDLALALFAGVSYRLSLWPLTRGLPLLTRRPRHAALMLVVEDKCETIYWKATFHKEAMEIYQADQQRNSFCLLLALIKLPYRLSKDAWS